MQRYIDQVIEDIDQLLEKEPPFKNAKTPENIWEELEEMEESFQNDKGFPVVEFSNISQEQLPPAEALAQEHLTLLIAKIQTLLNHCNFFLEFPDNLPESMMYTAIRENWEKFKLPEMDFFCHYEFCGYEEENCPFPGYCNKCEECEKEI